MEQPVTARDEVVRRSLEQARLDVLVCSLPINVLLLTGYWPVVGCSIAIASRSGGITLIVPEDEDEFAERSWADDVVTFQPGSLDRLTTAHEELREPLQRVLRGMCSGRGRVGIESGESFEPAPYASMTLYLGALRDSLAQALPDCSLESADDLLMSLRAVLTPGEVERVRTACTVAGQAFVEGKKRLAADLHEVEAASLFRIPLSTCLTGLVRVERCDGYVWCMSGANSAKAFGAYARSTAKKLERGDLVLMHCNSYADGYWTDITRTYSLGALDDQKRAMYDSVFAAREAALNAIRPGARGCDVDLAARKVLEARGFGKEFKHGTGHGVGFAAINHNARPRIHPKSEDVLEEGMVFNVEPAIYVAGYGGIRHCDMVLVTGSGYELLTPFQCDRDSLVI